MLKRPSASDGGTLQKRVKVETDETVVLECSDDVVVDEAGQVIEEDLIEHYAIVSDGTTTVADEICLTDGTVEEDTLDLATGLETADHVIVDQDGFTHPLIMDSSQVVIEDDVTAAEMNGQHQVEEEQLVEQHVEHMLEVGGGTAGSDAEMALISEVDGQLERQTVEMHMQQVPVTEQQLEASEIQSVLQYQNIIIQHMDISQPLTSLSKLLETRLQCSLADHEFYLQDTIQLDPAKNLVSQCVQGSGMVQINVEVKSQPGVKPRLNIVDILKPAEELLDVQPSPEPSPAPQDNRAATKIVIPFPEESENVTRWIVDQKFRKEQERLKIPLDPQSWNEAHVKHWLQWAVKEFALIGVAVHSFHLNGRQLCKLKHHEFIQYVPNDPGDIFWTHLELLRKCKFVAVIQQPTPHAITTITVSTSDALHQAQQKGLIRTPRMRTITLPSDRSSPGNRTGNNGQVQLWQFLLEMLTDKQFQEIIHWVGDNGEFKLNNPEVVAQLWGQRKNKPTMNYEKLSRALRYYYDGDMIAKVHGRRFVYKFVCDLQMLLGYSAEELNRLVTDCSERNMKSHETQAQQEPK